MVEKNIIPDSDLERILDAPIYSTAEASRLVGLKNDRTRRWLQGYEYRYSIAHGLEFRDASQPPVIRRGRTEGTTYASFLDLIDLLFVTQFLNSGHSLQKVRRALDEAAYLLKTNHFAREIFFTDGYGIYLQIGEKGNAILQLLTGGQWVIAPIITELAKRIDFHATTGLAQRWYPLGRDNLVVIDPLISFGRPSIKGKGVATSNVYDFYIGENEKIQIVCKWLNLTQNEARAAVDYEYQLAA